MACMKLSKSLEIKSCCVQGIQSIMQEISGQSQGQSGAQETVIRRGPGISTFYIFNIKIITIIQCKQTKTYTHIHRYSKSHITNSNNVPTHRRSGNYFEEKHWSSRVAGGRYMTQA